MAGWKKLLLGVVALAGGLLLLAILLVKIYITPEKVHHLVQTGLEESLQRKVSLGAVEVGLLSGIRLEKLIVQTKDRNEVLLSAEDIELSYDFMALLRWKLLLGQVLIKEPQLRLVREVDGRLNIDDLLGRQPVVAEAGDSRSAADKAEPAAGISLLVKRFLVQGGALQFIDRKLNPQSSYRYRLENLDLDVENFSLKEPFSAHLAATLNDASLGAELQFDLSEGLQTLQIHIDQLNLVPFLPYLQDLVPGTLGQGLLSTELQVSKQPEGFATRGQVVFDQLDIGLNLANPLHWNNVRIAVDQDLLYRLADQVVEVNKLQIDVDGIQAGYRGKVLLAEPLQLAGEGNLKVLDLRQISALLPRELRDQVSAYAVAGGLEAQFVLQGTPSGAEVIQQASLQASDLQGSIGDLRPALNGMFRYAAGRVQGERLRVDLNGQVLRVDLEATQILSSLPQLQLMIAGEKLDLDLLGKSTKTAQPDGVTKADQRGGSSATGSHKEPLLLPVAGRTSVQFAQLVYRGLLLEKVQGVAVLRDGTLTLEGLDAGLAGGLASLTGKAELARTKVPYSGHLKVTGIGLAKVADALLPDAQGSISGTLAADSTFSGYAGTGDLVADLNSAGNFDLRDGEIKGSPLLAGLSQFLTNPQLEVVGFNRLHGNYGLKGRQGTIDAQLESRRIFIAPRGSFSLDGPLNIVLETRVAPEVMAKSGVGGAGAELLKDAQGWTLLPLKVKGSYSQPHFTLDSRGVQKQLKQGVANELGRQLQKQLGGGTEDPQNQQMQKLLDGTLKKLFGN